MTNHSMKLLNVFIAFQIFSFSSSAQTFIGIDAAVNTSHWTLSLNGSSLNYPNQLGWSAGVPVEFTLSKIFNLCTGIRYANKGTTTIEFIFDNIKLDPVLSNINSIVVVPLLAYLIPVHKLKILDKVNSTGTPALQPGWFG